MVNKHPYYNFDKLYSFNGTFNFLAGGRGIGKTYGAKRKALKAALSSKGEQQFIYLRRYKTELATARATFLADIVHEFPGYDFRINGSVMEASPSEDRADKKDRQWITLGYFMALSTAQNQKSVAFPKVRTIIFDEFIIEKGAIHYLPEEVTIFTNFYSTVDRYQDKTKVFFLANSVSIMNPYFLEYGIIPEVGKDFVTKADGFIVCHFPDSKDFQNSVYETRFGKFIKDSEYAEYAVGNEFSDNTDVLLSIKDYKARYMFTLECKGGTFSIWHSLQNNEYFIQSKVPKDQEIYTLVPERMAPNKILISTKDRPLAYLRTAFRAAKISFDNPTTRNTFTEIFK